MNLHVVIGHAPVCIENAERLPPALCGLKRMPADSAPATDIRPATLTVEVHDAKHWPLDVSVRKGIHCFGRPTYAVEVAPAFRRIRLMLTTPPEGNDLYWLQRDIFGILACLSGEVMLHASAIATGEGSAWVFCGNSGAGKSTIARLLQAEGMEVINDEVNWLFMGGDKQVQIVSQPYWFGNAAEHALPVERLCLLEQSETCALKPPPPKSEVFARLLAAHLSIDTSFDFLEARARALQQLVMSHDIDVLQFNLDAKEVIALLCTSCDSKKS